MNQFFAALVNNVSGDVRFDPVSCALYSTDASIYQIKPLGVVIPKTRTDIVATVQLCAEHHVPVIARGGGTSQTGSCLGRGIVLDCSKYLRGVTEINTDEGWASVEPGVVPDELNAKLRPTGMMFPVDISPSNRANIGGMCATNAGGSRSIRYGIMQDNVLAMDAVLADGSEITAAALAPAQLQARLDAQTLEGQAYRTVLQLAHDHRAAIAERFPKIQRRVGGYNLDAFVSPENFNFKKILVGSEGTLAVTLGARVKLVPRPKFTAVGVVHYDTIGRALESVGEILQLGPDAVELVDKYFLDLTRAQRELGRRMHFLQGDPGALLIVEFVGDSQSEVLGCLKELELRLPQYGAYACTLAADATAQQNIWSVRKQGLGLLLGAQGDEKPFAFVEDSAVPAANLAAYFREFDEIVRANGTRAAYYGHASIGLLHIRPLINLKQLEGVERMYAISRAITELALKYAGAISGEHGDGLSRSEFNARVFGTELYEAFRTLKRTFDPQGILNPGKITDSQKMTENLRFGASYRAQSISTRLDFAAAGGFDRAIEMCNGNGECRKRLTGTMCPSYIATQEEKHSTRGRANALRAAISGNLPEGALTSRELYEVMDLCLECKGCKGECPSNVDMAKLKYEFLAQYQDAHGVPLRSRLFANIHSVARLGHMLAPLVNPLLRSGLAHKLNESVLGIAQQRSLPPFAGESFRGWFGKRKAAPPQTNAPKPVLLFVDTYTDFNYPQIGQAAVRVLEAAGYRVQLAGHGCCGRPMISKGLLDDAKRAASKNVRVLDEFAAQDIPIVGLEPSCLLTLRDEYLDLLPDNPQARRVADHSFLIEEFISAAAERGEFNVPWRRDNRTLLVHGHCYQKALVGTAPLLKMLKLPGWDVSEINSGCCGMAGSFGYEAEHYALSQTVGNDRLFPAVRAAGSDTLIAASGISCRQQIEHGTARQARHPIEYLADALETG